MIAFIEYVIQPIAELKTGVEGAFKLDIDRPEKYGGPLSYDSIEQLKADFVDGKLAPPDLKLGVADKINGVGTSGAEFESSEEFQVAQKNGYPVENQNKKRKEVKKIGTRYPGTVSGGDSADTPANSNDGEKLKKRNLQKKSQLLNNLYNIRASINIYICVYFRN